jgi:hypothetical protein
MIGTGEEAVPCGEAPVGKVGEGDGGDPGGEETGFGIRPGTGRALRGLVFRCNVRWVVGIVRGSPEGAWVNLVGLGTPRIPFCPARGCLIGSEGDCPVGVYETDNGRLELYNP